ncbi:MAG: class I SAM-dependent methyltransferase [Candidatus Sabulitectum sp.]|nr:class I SAM-dependent methyltransferase [Candidatus Sabulitectum sp.]
MRLLDDFIILGKVLDIGCGNGLYGVHLESRGCDVLQVDLVDRRDERARHLPFKIMDANDLDFADNKFDHVLAFDIMEHLSDDGKFLQNIWRVCNNHLFLSVPNADDEQIAGFGLTHIHHKDKTHQREYSGEQLDTILVNNGFNVLSIRPNYVNGLSYFARALARNNKLANLAARIIVIQCKTLIKIGLFENRTVGDWYCVAEKMTCDKTY